MANLHTIRGSFVLMAAHVAGMIDLVALPVWVGVLVQNYKFDFERAGLTVTLFLVGVVLASLVMAPLFNKVPRRLIAVAGFSVAAVAFYAASADVNGNSFFLLHALGGVGTGCGLSMAHGAIGRSANPHRLFAAAGAVLGVFAVFFYAIVPQLIAAKGGSVLFIVMGSLMAIAAVAAIGFPSVSVSESVKDPLGTKVSRTTWLAIGGVVCMALNQAAIFSFLERIGIIRGYGQETVNMLLAAIGVINLFPAVIAAFLQKRIKATTVAIVAPIAQAILALAITNAPQFALYAAAASGYAFVMIFAHTFLFGLIAKLDPSGRAVASTPAMLMIGSAIGPALAGTVAQRIGVGGLGVVTVVVSVVAVICFAKARRDIHASSDPDLENSLPLSRAN